MAIIQGTETIQDTLDWAARTRFTGAILGLIEDDPKTGTGFRSVFTYQRGECTDAHVTITSPGR
jgi:hypothetical protein